MRKRVTTCVYGAVMSLMLGGCTATDVYPESTRKPELQQDEFLRFATKCYRETSKTSRLLQGAIFISERTQTPEGPVLIMEAAGMHFDCLLNSDGSVTVSRTKTAEPDPQEDNT